MQSILNNGGSSGSLSTKEFDKIVESARRSELDDRHLEALSQKDIDKVVKFVRKAACEYASENVSHNSAVVNIFTQAKPSKMVGNEKNTNKENTSNDTSKRCPESRPKNTRSQPSASADLTGIYSNGNRMVSSISSFVKLLFLHHSKQFR